MEPFLTDDDIQNMCQQELEASTNQNSRIRSDQVKAVRQYFLEDTQPSLYSKVQSSDVRDTIEATLPVLMDMFTASEAPVVFRPTSQNDVGQAEAETQYVQQQIFTANEGRLIIYNWWKDALLLKNGYVKVFYDERVEEEREDYRGVTQEEYMALLNDPDYVVLEAAPADEMGMTVDVNGKRRREAGQVRIVNVPADRIYVSANHNEIPLQKAPYVSHKEYRSKSDLIIDGYDPEIVKDIPATTIEVDTGNGLNTSQRSVESLFSKVAGTDKSREMVEYVEHYIRADRNGDGIAELLQVCTAGGEKGKVLSIKEVDAIPIYACTAYPVPHSHYGLSLWDFSAPTQEIKTALLRQMIDNLYLSNKPMLEVDISRVVNPKVLQAPQPGSIIQSRGGGAVNAITVPFVAGQVLPVLQEFDKMLSDKTGITDTNSGLDATTLAGATNMVGAMTLNQSQLRMKAMLTMLCETGLRPVVHRVRELVMKFMRREDMMQQGSEWVPVNPRNWREKRDTELRIGIGTVQKQERMGVLQQIMGWQEKVVAAQGGVDGPLVNEQNIYNSLQDIERVAGHKTVDRYFSNPANFVPPPPKPDVASEALEIEKAKLEVSAQEKASTLELKAFELGMKSVELGAKLEADRQRTMEVAMQARDVAALEKAKPVGA